MADRQITMFIWIEGRKFAARCRVLLVPRIGESVILNDGEILLVREVVWDLRENMPGDLGNWTVNVGCERQAKAVALPKKAVPGKQVLTDRGLFARKKKINA